MNVLPFPGVLSTSMWPWWAATIPRAIARPSPVPFPSGFVVKNASKICSRASDEIPTPVSLTEKYALPSSRVPLASVRRPPSGVARVHGEVYHDLLEQRAIADDRRR
jgi:hypothetical protein